MSPARLTARTARIGQTRSAAAYRDDVRKLAAHLENGADQLRSEIAEVERICEDAGAVTVEARVAAVAADLGIPADELWAGIRALQEAVGATA